MSLFTLLFLSLGLATDAFAVSVSNGMCTEKKGIRCALPYAFAFAVAQGIMPVLGWLAGQAFASVIQRVAHWIALVVLVIIGVKMIAESRKKTESCEINKTVTAKTIVVQSLATSIDALAVGVSLAAMNVSILYSASIIAVITFVLCLIGAGIGNRVGHLLEDKAEVFGGVILILIGIKIFVEHTWF